MNTLTIAAVIFSVTIIGIVFLLRNVKIGNKGKNQEVSVDQKTKDKLNDLTTATELQLKNSLGNELIFKRPNKEGSKTKKYREVSLSNVNQVSGHLVNTAMPFLQQAVTVSQLEKSAPNGLFTTVVNPSTLSKFSDDSYTTMVRNTSNKLVEHQGFTRVVDIMKTNPIIAVTAGMQAMAAISGQYYLHQINAQLESISGKLDELVNYHNDEKIGLLLTAKERLLRIANKENVDTHDIGEIRTLMKDSLNVFDEYRVRLSRQQDELADFESKAFFGKDKIKALEGKVKEINFTTKIVYEADQLSIQAELSEIAVRMKLGDKSAIIQELTKQMKEHYDSSFYSTIDEFIRDEYRPVVRERYRKLGKKYLLKHPERLRQINDLVSLSEFKSMDSKIGELSQQLLLEQNKEQEILYLPSEDLISQRVFVTFDE